MTVLLHPRWLSPDPLRFRRGTPVNGFQTGLTLYPKECLRAEPPGAAAAAWAARLDPFTRPPPLALEPRAGRAELLLDFGTELEGELELTVRGGPCGLFASFGESVAEAETWGIPTTHPLQTLDGAVAGRDPARVVFPARGFRFVRLQVHDAKRPLRFERIAVRAVFGFREQPGDLLCSDARFQRAWQASAYTVRLCARENLYWDGIKRDRHGWFGDARVMQEAADAVYFDPRPARAMLAGQLPADRWAMGIPGYSLDAAAMLHQQALTYGLDEPGLREGYAAVRAMLEWAARTQCDRRGLIVRDPEQEYFSTVCFLDWSPMPLGGRFEDLSFLQCQHLEALRLAARVAAWLGRGADAARWTRRADALERVILSLFWDQRAGLRHTLRRSAREWLPMFNAILDPARTYLDLYHRPVNLGASSASRQSLALAWRAGLLADPARRRRALSLLQGIRLPAAQTPYFQYYIQEARAGCGDPAGALLALRDYLASQLEPNDSACVWEWHDPAEEGLRRFSLGDWPKSLCHGWGAGLIPLARRHLLGLRPLAPGWSSAAFAPLEGLPWAVEAAVPTPAGVLRVRKTARGKWSCEAPRGVTVVRLEKGTGRDA